MAQWFSRYIHTSTAVDIKPQSHWGKDLVPLSVPRNRWRLPLLLVFSLLLIHCRFLCIFSITQIASERIYIYISLYTYMCEFGWFFSWFRLLFVSLWWRLNRFRGKKVLKKRVLRKKNILIHHLFLCLLYLAFKILLFVLSLVFSVVIVATKCILEKKKNSEYIAWSFWPTWEHTGIL